MLCFFVNITLISGHLENCLVICSFFFVFVLVKEMLFKLFSFLHNLRFLEWYRERLVMLIIANLYRPKYGPVI